MDRGGGWLGFAPDGRHAQVITHGADGPLLATVPLPVPLPRARLAEGAVITPGVLPSEVAGFAADFATGMKLDPK